MVDFAKVVKKLSIKKMYRPDKMTGELVMRGNLPDESYWYHCPKSHMSPPEGASNIPEMK